MRNLASRVHRWHQLSRYYVNKWHYDGSKWAERVWYGQGSGKPNMVATVPFMITRNMKMQLEQAGFPASAISNLQPSVAHQVLTDKMTYQDFVRIQAELAAETQAATHQATLDPSTQPVADSTSLVLTPEATGDANTDGTEPTPTTSAVVLTTDTSRQPNESK
ncbi:TPA: hypothetical protein N0F65_007131 [Lagenidium giganteum]|uniref:Uncharacterized protein n=1 Tax=Lagenidium giganteum TaxID=4803 RepID=A0AAV2Z0R6_9STRA|nr:TPA: hypothetical protein N0F65_007131 [Lagenidium giganteum]